MRGRGEFARPRRPDRRVSALGDPLRIDFWGDEVESLRTFSIYSQRTTGAIPRPPCTRPSRRTPRRTSTSPACASAVADWERRGREDAEGARAPCGRACARDVRGPFHHAGRDVVASAGLASAVSIRTQTYRALADFDSEVTIAVPGVGLRSGSRAARGHRALLAKALHFDVVQRDQPIQFAASRPQFAARDLGTAERDLLRLVRDDYHVFVVFRHEGEAERATCRCATSPPRFVTPAGDRRASEERGPSSLHRRAAPQGFRLEDLRHPSSLSARADPLGTTWTPLRGRHAPHDFFNMRPSDYIVHRPSHRPASPASTAPVTNVTHDYSAQTPTATTTYSCTRPDQQGHPLHQHLGPTPSLDSSATHTGRTVQTPARTATGRDHLAHFYHYTHTRAIGFYYSAGPQASAPPKEPDPFRPTTRRKRPSTGSPTSCRGAARRDRLICRDMGYGRSRGRAGAASQRADPAPRL